MVYDREVLPKRGIGISQVDVYEIDLFSLDSLFSHFRTRDILLRIVLLSALKLFIHIHGTI